MSRQLHIYFYTYIFGLATCSWSSNCFNMWRQSGPVSLQQGDKSDQIYSKCILNIFPTCSVVIKQQKTCAMFLSSCRNMLFNQSALIFSNHFYNKAELTLSWTCLYDCGGISILGCCFFYSSPSLTFLMLLWTS